jgi:hypothetical protein
MLKRPIAQVVAVCVLAVGALVLGAVWFFSDGRAAGLAHDAAQGLWESKEPTAYSFEFAYCSGLCARCDLRITVRDGEVSDVASTTPDCAGTPQDAPTIDDVLAMESEDRRAETTDSFEIIYDPVWGFPASVDIRCPYGWADCGTGYTVTDFRVEP